MPRAPRLDCGNCIPLQVVEQLMGRSQGPAVTKGNLLSSLFLIVVAGYHGSGCRGWGAGFTHTHPPTHTRRHTHSSDCDAGKEGSLLAGGRWGLARVRVFSSYWEIWRLSGMKGRADSAHSQSNTLENRNGFHPREFFPPLSPQCHPLEGPESRPGGAFSPPARSRCGWRRERAGGPKDTG